MFLETRILGRPEVGIVCVLGAPGLWASSKIAGVPQLPPVVLHPKASPELSLFKANAGR